jgi:hypothetical protein
MLTGFAGPFLKSVILLARILLKKIAMSNFLQVYSHVGLINAAYGAAKLDRPLFCKMMADLTARSAIKLY